MAAATALAAAALVLLLVVSTSLGLGRSLLLLGALLSSLATMAATAIGLRVALLNHETAKIEREILERQLGPWDDDDL